MGKPENNLLIVNSTQVPNVFLDRVMAVATDAIFKCLMCVTRQTYGWRKEWDAISTTQIEKLTGLSNRSVIDNMAHLREAGLVIRRNNVENPQWGLEYSLNTKADLDKAIEYLMGLRKEREKREKPSGGRKNGKESYEPGSQQPMNGLHPYEPLAGATGFIAPHEPGSQQPMNGVHTQKQTIKTNYQKGEELRPPLSPNVALIARKNLMERLGDNWRDAQARMQPDNKRQALYHFVKMCGAQEGLEHFHTKQFLNEHPGWKDWPDLEDLDSQREIDFPEPPKPQSVSAREGISLAGVVVDEGLELKPGLKANKWLWIVTHLEKKLSRHVHDTWLRPTRYIGDHLGKKILYVRVPNKEFLDIGERFGDAIHSAIDELNLDLLDVKFLTAEEQLEQSA